MSRQDVARFSKTVLKVGEWQSPQGPVKVTPERLAHWAKTHAEIKAAGNKPPFTWGHHLAAVPAEFETTPGFDKNQFLGATMRAGECDEMRVNGDGLEAVGDCPGVEVEPNGSLTAWRKLKDGTAVKTAIKEVSASIMPEFKDGKGRVWKDVLGHIALVPYPVVNGQDDGFKQLPDQVPAGVQCLSLGETGWHLMGGNMPKPSEPPAGGKKAEDDFEDDVEVEPEEEEDEEAGDEYVDEGGENYERLPELIQLLGEVCNVHIPEPTNPKEFCDHLRICLTHMKTASNGQQMPATDRPVDEAQPVVAEQSPAMMALIQSDPAAKAQQERIQALEKEKWQGQLDKQKTDREVFGRKLQRLATEIPKDIFESLGFTPQTVCLSVAPTGETREMKVFSPNQVVNLLHTLAKRLPTKRKITRTLAVATAEPNLLSLSRERADEATGKVDDEKTDRMARRLAGVGPASPSRNGHGKNGKKTRRR